MRPSTLRALLKELRAGGVSEFSSASKRETVTLKLAGPFTHAQQSPSKGKASASAAKPFPPISSELRKQMEDIGIDADQAHEVLRDVGISAGVDDGN